MSSDGYTADNTAFVFNHNQKYIPNNYDKAIRPRSDGFEFGIGVLDVEGDQLNADNNGWCCVGKN